MKVFYLNDETSDVKVFVNTLMNEPITIKPQQGKMFYLSPAPKDAVPFIKRWDRSVILISYMTAEAAESLDSLEQGD